MNEIVLETKNLSKRYGKQTALHPLNLTLEKGCIYGLIGKNGAGKTTLLKLLAGQAAATSGEIKIFGKSGADLEMVRKRTGTIVEHPAFFPNLSGRQNLEYYRIQKGIVEKDCVEQVLRELDLLAIANKKFRTYSLGNKQRLGLALALMGNPDLLILDEPINGFDPMGILEIRKLLLELNQRKHMTIIISSHILSELENLITRVGFIDEGQLIEEVSMEELQSKCQQFVEVKVSHPEKAVALLEEKLGIAQYEVLPEQVIKIQGSRDLIPQISKLMNGHQIEVYSLRELETSLEDYFIELIGGHPHG